MSIVALSATPIDPEVVRRSVEDSALGGVVVFIGEVRSVTGDQATAKLEYSAYDAMAVSEMEAIAEQAKRKWQANVAIAHRVGELLPGDVAVVTAAACAHRAEAFDCCRFLIDRIKGDVPIWKKEFGADGAVWIEGDARVSG